MLPVPDCVPIAALDECYFSFVQRLPTTLQQAALEQRNFRGSGDAGPITSLQDLHVLATALPWLFREAFPAVAESEVLAISEAGTLLILALLVQDHYLDGQLTTEPQVQLLHQQLHTAAVRNFTHLFDPESVFWPYFDTYCAQYTDALVAEQTHWGTITAYPLSRMYRIGSGKVALLKTMTTALALKADAETLISPLEDAVDALAAAMQLADDIEDWVEDYQCRRYTLPLTWAIPEMTGSAPQLAVAEVRQRLDESVILETLVKQIIEWFEDALTSVSTLHASCWIAFVENCLQKTRSYQQTLVAQKVRSIMSGSLHFHESNPFPSTPA